jgi:hypothetical protein
MDQRLLNERWVPKRDSDDRLGSFDDVSPTFAS